MFITCYTKLATHLSIALERKREPLEIKKMFCSWLVKSVNMSEWLQIILWLALNTTWSIQLTDPKENTQTR